jgi:uncharacterized protein YecE (DUF72 family)
MGDPDGTVPAHAPRIGCAGWALEKKAQPDFPAAGTHLQRYAAVFPCVEINSSFYRPHKPDTYRRWSESVPDAFRFSAKVPKAITHAHRLEDCAEPLHRFLSEVTRLGAKLGPLLIQLPPSLAFRPATAEAFFAEFRARFHGLLALEPRHPTWFRAGAEALLRGYRIARAAADPAVVPEAAEPGGWNGFVYRRLHGSPRMYYSEYSGAMLSAYADALSRECGIGETWCIFDNTAEGHALPNARTLMENLRRLSAKGPPPPRQSQGKEF